MFDFCVNVEVGSFNVVRLVTTSLSSLLSSCYLHFSPKSCMIKGNGNKYKKNPIKLKKQVRGMVMQKKYTNKSSRENNRQGASLTSVFIETMLLDIGVHLVCKFMA